jgi:hypothetical protein
MKFNHFAAVFLAMLVLATLLAGLTLNSTSSAQNTPNVYIGVDAGSTDLNQLKALAQEVESYTNIFIVGSFPITWNYTKLTDICQLLNDEGLNFMVFEHPEDSMPFAQWLSMATQKWSTHFLGIYGYDEPGGYQIDKTDYMAAKVADNYSDAAAKYVANVTDWLSMLRDYCGGINTTTVVSDYVLYEYDYRAGYDAVFAEFGWNFSRPLYVALCRGAATMHDKPWGAIITYTYTVPPYLETGQQVYEDMVYAYQNGAKYILLFDYDTNTTLSILQPQHLEALKQFWQYVKENPQPANAPADRVAYVLPKDYGYGFRGPNDTVWGLWGPDENSAKVWNDANTLLQEYGANLDIIYEDSLNGSASPYSKLIFWNGTEIG